MFSLVLIAASLGGLRGGAAGMDLAAWLAEPRKTKGFLAPHADETAAAEALFRDLMLIADPALAARLLGPEDFRVETRERPGSRLLLLEEQPAARRGRGLYVLRPAAGLPILWQAPHRFHDRWSGEIVARLVDENPVAAAAFNSQRRGPGIDLARLEASHFNAFALAFAALHARGLVVQLHGFDQDRRKNSAARQADLIVSSATHRASPLARSVAACLADSLDSEVRLFPDQVDELGGTANATARVLRARGFTNFLHLEASRSLRLRLRDEASLRARLAACFAGAVS